MQCVICTTLCDDSPKHHHSSHHTYLPGLVSKGSDDDQQEGLRCSDKELDKNGNMFCNCISVHTVVVGCGCFTYVSLIISVVKTYTNRI